MGSWTRSRYFLFLKKDFLPFLTVSRTIPKISSKKDFVQQQKNITQLLSDKSTASPFFKNTVFEPEIFTQRRYVSHLMQEETSDAHPFHLETIRKSVLTFSPKAENQSHKEMID